MKGPLRRRRDRIEQPGPGRLPRNFPNRIPLNGEIDMRLKITLLSLMAAAAALPLLSQEPAEISFQSTELAPGLYMIEGVGGFAGGNLGLLMGDDGVVLIDDGLPPLIGGCWRRSTS